MANWVAVKSARQFEIVAGTKAGAGGVSTLTIFLTFGVEGGELTTVFSGVGAAILCGLGRMAATVDAGAGVRQHYWFRLFELRYYFH